MNEEHPLPILIAGAGPGGLTAALRLKQLGASYLLVEKSSRDHLCADVGGGYDLMPSTLRIMDRLGVGDAVRDAADRFASVAMCGANGSRINTIPMPLDLDACSIRRSEMQRVLLGRVGEDSLCCGAAVETFEQDEEGVTLHLADGRELRGSALIGADGVHSRVREAMLGDGAPLFAGVSCCWGRLPYEGRQRHHGFPDDEMVMVLGQGASFMAAVCRGEILWSAFWRTPSFVPSKDRESTKRKLVERFSDWLPMVSQTLAESPSERIAEVGIWDRDPAETWWEGRAALIGDAAHPMTPFAGQGANTAIMDAFVLGTHLATSPPEVAFPTYEKCQKSPAEKIVKRARAACNWFTTEQAWKRKLVRVGMGMLPHWVLSWGVRSADRGNEISDLLALQLPTEAAAPLVNARGWTVPKHGP